MLKAFGEALWLADGPPVRFLGQFDYPTRMAVARLGDGSAWIWSPIAWNESLSEAVASIGPVRHLVAPNKIHHLHLAAWAERHAGARLWAAPGLARRRRDLYFDGERGDAPEPEWAAEIDQTVFRGSLAMEEVAFFHRASRTAIVCDLVQRHDPARMTGFKGMLMRLDGLVGEGGSTPREWRASFLRRGPAREAREKLLAWRPQRLLIAHGACAQENATGILARALAWM